MTGEMSWIKPNGDAGNGESYPVHAAVARALRCRLRPFDTYIGPYIDHRKGRVWISSEDGAVGTVCVWPGGVAPAYCKPVTVDYFPLDNITECLAAAREALKRIGPFSND